MKRLGIDLGQRRVGLAWHDDPDLPARPLATLDVREIAPGQSVVEALAAVAAREGAEELVVGLALQLDGREGLAARATRRVAAALGQRAGLPVVLWDERLTTTQAQRGRTARGQRGRAGIDAEAAAILLQSYVDAKRGGSGWDPDRDSE